MTSLNQQKLNTMSKLIKKIKTLFQKKQSTPQTPPPLQEPIQEIQMQQQVFTEIAQEENVWELESFRIGYTRHA